MIARTHGASVARPPRNDHPGWMYKAILIFIVVALVVFIVIRSFRPGSRSQRRMRYYAPGPSARSTGQAQTWTAEQWVTYSILADQNPHHHHHRHHYDDADGRSGGSGDYGNDAYGGGYHGSGADGSSAGWGDSSGGGGGGLFGDGGGAIGGNTWGDGTGPGGNDF